MADYILAVQKLSDEYFLRVWRSRQVRSAFAERKPSLGCFNT
jgi:hypothetical protein